MVSLPLRFGFFKPVSLIKRIPGQIKLLFPFDIFQTQLPGVDTPGNTLHMRNDHCSVALLSVKLVFDI